MPAGVEAAVARFDAALRTAGLGGLEPPDDAAVLERVDTALAPHRLPADLRRFWELVRADALVVEAWLPLLDPAAALDLYERERDFAPLYGPQILFPVGAHSDARRLVELESEWSLGGTVFASEAGTPFRLEHRTFADLVDTLADCVAAGAYMRHGESAVLDYDTEVQRAASRLRDSPADPIYGDVAEVPSELAAWPAHWLAAAGIRPEDRVPLGATHTIAELVHEAAAGPVRGRIAGEVVRLVAIGSDVFVIVDDGSGQLDVLCPAGTSVWGPRHRDRFEFEVTMERPPVKPPDFDAGTAEIQQAALGGRLDAAQAAVTAFFGRIQGQPPSAVASDVRPLD